MTETAAPAAAPPTVSVPVAAARLRSGVATSGPNNIVLDPLPAGNYPAIKQCKGERVTIGGATNEWWVQITAQGRTGWVSAVVITVGGNDEEIPGVPPAPTVNT